MYLKSVCLVLICYRWIKYIEGRHEQVVRESLLQILYIVQEGFVDLKQC